MDAVSAESATHSAGVAFDMPCPQCEYNLRGLTTPRCPECGFQFTWADLEAWRRASLANALRDQPASPTFMLLVLGVLFVVFTALQPELGFAIVFLLLLITVPFLVSGVQAAVEIVVVWPLVVGLKRRFRSWWEGVLIGYGAGAMTLWLLGHPLIIFERARGWHVPYDLWPIMLLTTSEMVLIQYWVVRRRSREAETPIPPWRLVVACLVAKAFIAFVWFFCPFSVERCALG